MAQQRIAPKTDWTPERVAAAARNAAIVIVGGVLLGVFATRANLYYVGAVVAGSVLTVLVAWRFEVALVIYALVAFVPWGSTPDLAVGGSGVGKGVYVSEAMLGFLLVVWVAKYLLKGLPKNRPSSGFRIPLALYLCYCVLNVVNSHIFWDAHVNRMYQYPVVNVIDLGLHFLSGGAFLMMASSVTSRKWLTCITVALLAPGIYNALNVLAGSKIPIAAPWWPLLALLPAGYFWAITLDPAQTMLRRSLSAGVVALVAFTVFVQGVSWVSGWLGLFTTLAAVTFIKSRKAFLAMLAVTLVLGVVGWPFLHQNVVEASRKEGDFDRFALMSGAMKYATTFPLGVGLGNYRSYNSFHYGQKWGTASYTSAHGTYSQHLSEMGFPGLALFAALLVCGFSWMLRSYRRVKSGQSRIFLLASMGQMVGIACAATIGDYIVPTYHNGGITTFSATVYSWLIWGLAVAHVGIDSEESGGSIGLNS